MSRTPQIPATITRDFLLRKQSFRYVGYWRPVVALRVADEAADAHGHWRSQWLSRQPGMCRVGGHREPACGPGGEHLADRQFGAQQDRPP